MKTKIVLLFLLGWVGIAFGQERKNITGKYYITNVDIPVYEINFFDEGTTQSILNKKLIATKETKFTVIEILDNNTAKIKFWKYKKQGDSDQSQPKSDEEEHLLPDKYQFIDSLTSVNKYFAINIKDLDEKTQEYFGASRSFTYGITLIPFKLRFGGNNKSFQYGEGFSLGLNAGMEFNLRSRKQQAISILAGIAGSTVSVDSESTNNYIEEDKVTTSGAFTPSVGVVYAYERFQVGAFVGWDIIGGELGDNWIYNKKAWLGLGLGFTIFQKNKTESTGNQEQ